MNVITKYTANEKMIYTYVGWGRHYTYLSSIDQTLRHGFFFLLILFIDISLDKKLPLNVQMGMFIHRR